MHLIPSKMPEPKLISSVVPEAEEETSLSEGAERPFALGGSRPFAAHGRAIVVGIAVGAVVISIAGTIFHRQHRLREQEVAVPKVLSVTTRKVSGSSHSEATPAPMVVQIDSGALRISAIALGHPRLAVINGRTVAEGDTIVVHTPARAVAVTLRVLKISEGQVKLSDGTQVIMARLNIPSPAAAKQP
jgi:hypothetical protein